MNNGNTITLIPAATQNINVTAQINDNNGCVDLAGGTTTILLYRSGVGSSTCFGSGGVTGANPTNCYVATLFTSSSTCNTPQTSINTTTTFAMQYYAQATDASSSFLGQNWMATILFTDPNNATSTGDSSSASSTSDVATLVGLSINTSTITYGSIVAGTNTSSTNQDIIVTNAGNASTTLSLSGTALTSGANSIATSSQHYATTTFTYGGAEQALSDVVTTVPGFAAIAPIFNFPIGGAGWQNTTALPYRDYNHTSVAYNGYLYNIGGLAIGIATSTVLFAPINATGSIGAWTSTQALPYTNDFHVSVAYNGYLYNIGGSTSGGTTSTVLFAPINSTGSIGAWTATQALPYADEQHAAVIYNGYLYNIGGSTNGGSGGTTSTVLFARINATGSIGAWTSTQALPNKEYEHTSVAYNGYLYNIGGSTVGGTTSTVLFAPINATGSIGAWTSTQALPNTDEFHASAVYNGYLYTIGGCVDGLCSFPVATVLYAPINATGSLGAWTSTQALPYGNYGLASVAFNGYLYAPAGDADNANGTSTVLFSPLAAHDTYWGAAAPSNGTSGDYTGTVTFTAVYSP